MRWLKLKLFFNEWWLKWFCEACAYCCSSDFCRKGSTLTRKKSLGRSMQDNTVSVSCTWARWVCVYSPALRHTDILCTQQHCILKLGTRAGESSSGWPVLLVTIRMSWKAVKPNMLKTPVPEMCGPLCTFLNLLTSWGDIEIRLPCGRCSCLPRQVRPQSLFSWIHCIIDLQPAATGLLMLEWFSRAFQRYLKQ